MKINKYISSKSIIMLLLVAMIFWVIVMVYKSNLSGNNLIDIRYTEVNSNWNINNDGSFKLPKEIPDNNDVYTLTTSLSDFDYTDKNLSVRTTLGQFKIYIGDSLIYDYYNNDFFTYSNSARAKIHNIDIPKGISGDKIIVKTENSGNLKAKPVLYDMVIGNETSIFYYYSHNEVGIFIVNAFLGVLSLILLLIGLIASFFKENSLKEISSVGLFMLFTTIYLLFELNITNYYIDSDVLYNLVKLGCLAFLGFPILQLVQNCLSNDNKLSITVIKLL